MGSDQEQIKAEIQPQHHNNNRSKTAVHVKSVKMLYINGKSPGKYVPGSGGKNSPGNLVDEFHPTVGNKGIHYGKDQRHDAPGKNPPEMEKELK